MKKQGWLLFELHLLLLLLLLSTTISATQCINDCSQTNATDLSTNNSSTDNTAMQQQPPPPPSRVFGSVLYKDMSEAFNLLRQQRAQREAYIPTNNTSPSFFDYAFIPPPSTTSSALLNTPGVYTCMLYYCSRCPFSHAMLTKFNALAHAFPQIQFIAIHIDTTHTLQQRTTYINHTLTLTLPFVTHYSHSTTISSSNTQNTQQDTNATGAITTTTTSDPTITTASAVESFPPSVSFFTRGLVRACPTVLLLNGTVGVEHNETWGRSYHQLSSQLSRLTNITALPLNHSDLFYGTEASALHDDEQEVVDNIFEEYLLSASPVLPVNSSLFLFPLLSASHLLSGLDGYSDVGLLLSVLGMTIIHVLQRCRERIENYELEALAQQHAAL